MSANNPTQSQIEAIFDRALLDPWERDGRELLKHPLPGNRAFGRKLLREVKAMRANGIDWPAEPIRTQSTIP